VAAPFCGGLRSTLRVTAARSVRPPAIDQAALALRRRLNADGILRRGSTAASAGMHALPARAPGREHRLIAERVARSARPTRNGWLVPCDRPPFPRMTGGRRIG